MPIRLPDDFILPERPGPRNLVHFAADAQGEIVLTGRPVSIILKKRIKQRDI